MSRPRPFLPFFISPTLKFIIAMFILVLTGSVAFGYFFIDREMTLLSIRATAANREGQAWDSRLPNG